MTDTPFIDEKKQWVRDDKGAIAFRKGGHGALLENLNHLDADCIWIKNIDNILLGQSNAAGEKWMKILAGKLLTIQEALFEHLDTLEQQKSNTDFRPIIDFIQTHFDPDFNLKSESKMSHEVLFDYLHRPLRVCGMIPNKGAVGGGPFWKKEAPWSKSTNYRRRGIGLYPERAFRSYCGKYPLQSCHDGMRNHGPPRRKILSV